MTMLFWQRLAAFLAQAVGAVSVFCYTWYGWTTILAGELSLGTYMAFTMYSGYLTGPIRGLLGLVPQLQILVVHIERFLEIYDLRPKVCSPPQGATVRAEGDIVFDSVSFAYDKSPLILRDICLTVPHGTTVAILGASGTGKTSLVQLVPRFYDPEAGSVRIGGDDIRRCDLDHLRRRISYVEQRAFIFSGSIHENISIGHSNWDREVVEDAARKALLHDSVLENGLETQTGEAGSRLSEGQKQRIVLARLLLRRSPIVILDEATSALDLETEDRLMRVLHEELSDSTMIVVTHRLSAVQHADKIVMLEGGEISEEGDYDSLVAAKGLFAQMHARSGNSPPTCGVPGLLGK